MNNINEKVLNRLIIKENVFAYVVKFMILLGLATAAPFFHFQAITGTIVNATLLVAVVILGRKEAVAIGIFPSVISIITGFLVPAVLSLVPFIILSNIFLVLVFNFFRKRNYWEGVVFGSIAKFALLYFSGIILVKIFGWSDLAKSVTMMFSWQQLLTALSGGIVAYAVLRVIKKT